MPTLPPPPEKLSARGVVGSLVKLDEEIDEDLDPARPDSPSIVAPPMAGSPPPLLLLMLTLLERCEWGWPPWVGLEAGKDEALVKAAEGLRIRWLLELNPALYHDVVVGLFAAELGHGRLNADRPALV